MQFTWPQQDMWVRFMVAPVESTESSNVILLKCFNSQGWSLVPMGDTYIKAEKACHHMQQPVVSVINVYFLLINKNKFYFKSLLSDVLTLFEGRRTFDCTVGWGFCILDWFCVNKVYGCQRGAVQLPKHLLTWCCDTFSSSWGFCLHVSKATAVPNVFCNESSTLQWLFPECQNLWGKGLFSVQFVCTANNSER